MAEVFVPSTTGEGQGAAQIFQSNTQYADASGITDAIISETENRRKQQDEDRQRAINDALKLQKQENQLKTGKTPYFSSFGKKAFERAQERLKNGEISAPQYGEEVQRLTELRNFLESNSLNVAKGADGYGWDAETNTWRKTNRVNDRLSSADISDEDVDAIISEKKSIEDIMALTAESNDFLYKPENTNLNGMYNDVAKELVQQANPNINVFDVNDETAARQITKQVPVSDVLKKLYADDDFISALKWNMSQNQASPEEIEQVSTNFDVFKNQAISVLGVEDQYFKDQTTSLVGKKKEGGLVEGEDYTVETIEIGAKGEGESTEVAKVLTLSKPFDIVHKSSVGDIDVEVKNVIVDINGGIEAIIKIPQEKETNMPQTFEEKKISLNKNQEREVKAKLSGIDLNALFGENKTTRETLNKRESERRGNTEESSNTEEDNNKPEPKKPTLTDAEVEAMYGKKVSREVFKQMTMEQRAKFAQNAGSWE
jgi:hypothetical protein